MYATISHWEAEEINEEMIKTMKEKFMPMLKSLGAINCYEVQTSEKTVSIFTIFPDEKTKINASEKINKIRSQGASEFDSTMIKAEEGNVIASI